MKNVILCALLLNIFSGCNNNKAEREAEIETATQAAIDSVNAITERERLLDSMEATAAEPSITTPPATGTEGRTPTRTRTGTADKKGTSGKTDEGTVQSGSGSTPTTTTADPDNTTVKTEEPVSPENEPVTEEEKKKKGVNNTVKGAIIGAGAGAVGGAIINKKNPGKGAVIGGVAGAGAGAVTGVILDKNKKKKDAEAARKDSIAKANATNEPAPTRTTN